MTCIFISLKWEAKNTYLFMPARRNFYPPSVGRVYPPFFWRIGGSDLIYYLYKFIQNVPSHIEPGVSLNSGRGH